ncbi:MAG: putative bifunctional diguanylate cyclase/phosphodiesterase [Pseudomonadota bacterium]|jgi:diguanylate cyclase (GGDEF)-like protein/PAS domain S-box-containing protein
MSSKLPLRDALTPRLLCVESDQRYRDVIQADSPAEVFAVFDETRYLGLVSAKQAALFPGRIFADLVVLRQARPLDEETDLETAIARLQEVKDDFLPVQDKAGAFLGAVSRASLFAALSAAEHRLNQERASLIQRLEVELENRRIATAVFDATSEGIMVTDAQTHIILVNRAFSATTGYALDEVIGKTPHLLASGHHNRDFYTAMWHTIQDTGGWSGEIWNRRKNGETYPEWLHINAIRDDSGKITHYVGVFSDISQHKEVQKRLHDLAYHDALTHLPNRQLFYDRLEQTIAHARREQGGFTLLFLDLDRFKVINDTQGHGFGDRLLTEAARRLQNLVRASDTVARWGGDEFTLILHETTEDWEAAVAARKIVHAFQAPLHVDGQDVHLSASVGITRFPLDGENAEALVSHADAAMYAAKKEGGGRYSFFSPELNRRLTERLRVENALRTSLAAPPGEGGLHLAWQPQVRLADGAIIGVEVLARWRHPELGDIPPARFIPVAEESGLIMELGRWVLDEAARHAMRLCGRIEPGRFRISVNVSPRQMGHETMEDLVSIIERQGLRAECVELEITESALMSEKHSAEDALRKLGAQGVHFAVDDFGTGYSNLAYLKRFAVHRLKIDQAFVRDMVEDEADRQIVTAIVSMGHALGLKVIAEGVETEAQRRLLLELGCDEGQGFLFARPMPFDAFAALLAQPPTPSPRAD